MQQTPGSINSEKDDVTALSPVVEVTEKHPFVAPKLTYIEPKLFKHGNLEDVTGFFGSFSP